MLILKMKKFGERFANDLEPITGLLREEGGRQEERKGGTEGRGKEGGRLSLFHF